MNNYIAQLRHTLPHVSSLIVSFLLCQQQLLTGPERALDPLANSAEPDHTFNAKCRQGADYLLLKQPAARPQSPAATLKQSLRLAASFLNPTCHHHEGLYTAAS